MRTLLVICIFMGAFFANHASGAFVNTMTFGQCAETPIIKNFSIPRYVGVWYEQERTPNFFQRGSRCTHAKYSQLNQTAIAVENRGLNPETGDGTLALGTATVPNLDEPNKLVVNFPPSTRQGRYEVWTTDYDKYAVVYACTQSVPYLLKMEFVWILSKTPQLHPVIVQHLKDVLGENGVNVANFRKTDQTNCTYLAL